MSTPSRPFTSSRALPLIPRAHSRPYSCDYIPSTELNTPRPGQESLWQGKSRRLTLRTQMTQADLDKHQVKLGLISTYRDLNRLTRKSTIKNKTVPELQYFTEIQRQRLKPELTIFTRKSSQTHINFQECGLGDDYAAAVSVAISNNPYLETLNFKNNRLRESGSLRIIETLRLGRVKEVNLSENDIGVKGVEALSQLLRESLSIEKLSLEKAVRKRQTLNIILEAVTANKSLLELNLARNGITAGNGSEFFALLTTNSTLKRLDLHWNTIRGPVAVQLFKGLRDNRSLQELDISWNSLGNDPSLELGVVICQVFGENDTLKHLDLSYNYFTFPECEKVAEGIKANHTILGIHMVGNNCDVDSQGFLLPTASQGKDMEAHTLQRMLSPRSCKSHPQHSNCWLCEKWTAVTFEWNFQQVVWNRRLKHIAQEHKESTEPVFLHMDIDGYKPELMSKDADGSYRVCRAVPASGVKFFFTYRGYAQVSFAYPLFHVPEPESIEISFFNSVIKLYSLVLLNQCQDFDSTCSLEETFPVLPRPGPWVYEADPAEGPVIYPEWTLEKSVFRTYKFDNEKLLKECLDFDWAHSHLNNLVKSEFEQMAVKTVLLHIYDQLKEAFRLYCSFEKFSVSKMTLSALTDLTYRMSLIDSQRFRISDLDLNVRGSLMDGSQHIAAINRTEFMEIIVRTAMHKYLKTGICPSESTALSRFAAVHVKPVLGKFNSDQWRKERYLNEKTDQVYTTHLDTLHVCYARYSGKYAQGGEKPWMSLEEFIQCCKVLGLTAPAFTSHLYSLCYQLSLMTHKDLARSKREYQMSFVEFLEGIARVADFKDLEEPEEAMVQGKWGEESLDLKLESMLLETAKARKSGSFPPPS